MKLEWSPLCQFSFDSIKLAPTVLILPQACSTLYDTLKPFILTCDASDFGIGYTLSQLDNNKKECPVAYGEKSLTNEERK